jgi:hypoxanthine phosphoribosyltransferase
MHNFASGEIVFSEDDLKRRAIELGREITKDYAGKDLILVGVLKGAVFFLCDLSRAIDLPMQIDFISIGVQSGASGRSGVVQITKDLEYDIAGRHVLVIEDIIRSGLTTGYIMQALECRGAASLKICTLLQCPEEQLINMPIAYVGFEITKVRLLGYGLDVDEKGRNIPHIEQIP